MQLNIHVECQHLERNTSNKLIAISSALNKIQFNMTTTHLKDGDFCKVIAGTHKGKSGFVQDINKSKTGHITITVLQKNGVRFKTLGKNVEVTNEQ